MSKYVYDANGIPVIDPNYRTATGQAPVSSIATNGTQLVVVSSMQDQADMAALTKVGVPQQMRDTIATLQSLPYRQAFNAGVIDESSIVEGLERLFQKYEIPIGLMSKLSAMQRMKLHFKIDDSSSMAQDSNLLTSDVSPYMIGIVDKYRRVVTRWEEAQDRLHVLIDLLAYVPTGPIKLSFFDHGFPGQHITLDRTGKTPEAFLADAHEKISTLFANHRPSGGTPILRNLTHMLNEANQNALLADTKTMHYILTDGEPSDGQEEIRQIKNLLQQRDASANPVTFFGLSNLREGYAWIHEMEEVAKFVAALPDFRDELMDVKRDQGVAFPYTK